MENILTSFHTHIQENRLVSRVINYLFISINLIDDSDSRLPRYYDDGSCFCYSLHL